MSEVKIKENETLESALRRLKEKQQWLGLCLKFAKESIMKSQA